MRGAVVAEEETSLAALGRGLTAERREKRSVIAMRVSRQAPVVQRKSLFIAGSTASVLRCWHGSARTVRSVSLGAGREVSDMGD